MGENLNTKGGVMRQKWFCALVVVVLSFSLRAATRSIWTDTTSLSATWQTGSSWSTGSYPNSADADAVLSELDDNVSQVITVGDTSYSISDLWLNALPGLSSDG